MTKLHSDRPMDHWLESQSEKILNFIDAHKVAMKVVTILVFATNCATAQLIGNFIASRQPWDIYTLVLIQLPQLLYFTVLVGVMQDKRWDLSNTLVILILSWFACLTLGLLLGAFLNFTFWPTAILVTAMLAFGYIGLFSGLPKKGKRHF